MDYMHFIAFFCYHFYQWITHEVIFQTKFQIKKGVALHLARMER